MALKVLDSIWFTPMGAQTIGVVLAQDVQFNTIKCYIGIAEGYDKENDENKILQQGAKFPLTSAATFFGSHIIKEDQNEDS